MDPVALPRLPESIPSYYRGIIDLCRAVDPNNRPPAWRLLDMFPPQDGTNFKTPPQPEIPKPEEFDISSLKDSFDVVVDCDFCHKPVIYGGRNMTYFHCNIGREGDFDLCRPCFDGGLHRFGRDHLLVEAEKTRTTIVTIKYYSSVGESGKRDCTEV